MMLFKFCRQNTFCFITILSISYIKVRHFDNHLRQLQSPPLPTAYSTMTYHLAMIFLFRLVRPEWPFLSSSLHQKSVRSYAFPLFRRPRDTFVVLHSTDKYLWRCLRMLASKRFLAFRDHSGDREPEYPLHATGYANVHTLWVKWLTLFVAWYPNIL
jgi:hypothetical protein